MALLLPVAATEIEGVCRAPGVQGGLAMLSRLQEGPLSRVLLTGIPAQGGFNAVYLGTCLYIPYANMPEGPGLLKIVCNLRRNRAGLDFCLPPCLWPVCF